MLFPGVPLCRKYRKMIQKGKHGAFIHVRLLQKAVGLEGYDVRCWASQLVVLWRRAM